MCTCTAPTMAGKQLSNSCDTPGILSSTNTIFLHHGLQHTNRNGMQLGAQRGPHSRDRHAARMGPHRALAWDLPWKLNFAEKLVLPTK